MESTEMTGLIKNSQSSGNSDPHQPPHHGNACYNITADFISLALAVAEIGLVLYLSISHFLHSRGVIAIAMLGPILLNFVGVSYFFSNPDERKEFERVGVSRCAKDLFQAPVLGPVFTAAKVLSISCGFSSNLSDYERFEASAIKMRQAESFFGAAPEALVQLTVFLVTAEQSLSELTLDNYLEITVVIVSVITLSEANMYAMLSNYYRIFHTYGQSDWKLPHVLFWQKCILFFHSFFSIGSRIAAMACLKAAVKYFYLLPTTTLSSHAGPMSTTGSPATESTITFGATETTMTPAHSTHSERMTSDQANQLGQYLIVFFLCEIGFRMVFYYIVRLIKFAYIGEGIPSGCHESINYGWRSTILDLGFQSKNIAVQIWWYLENSICFIIWWCSLTTVGQDRPMIQQIRDNVLPPLTAIFVVFTLLSVFLVFASTGLKLHTLRGPFKQYT